MFTSFVSSRSLSVRGSWGTAPSVFWYGAPGGTQGPPGKGGAAERWRVTPSVGWVTRHGAQPATTRAYKSNPPPGRRAHQALQKAPPKATTNQARKKEPLPTPERLFLLFWFIPATHLPGGAASRTRRPHPRPCGRRWEKSPASDSSCGRTPSPCPYQSQSTAAHPPY